MAKTYTELEAWAIFIGALITGVVLTSLFWAIITVPEEVKNIEKEIKNASESVIISEPKDFVAFCKQIGGISKWDSNGFKQCSSDDYTQKNLIMMKLLCQKFNLSLSYGSFGVKCE